MLELKTPPEQETWIEYVPDFRGNRGLEEPFTIELKPLNSRQMKQLKAVLGTGKIGRGGFDADERAWKLAQRLFEDNGGKVTRFRTVDQYGNIVEPENGKELWKCLTIASDRDREDLTDDVIEALRDFSKLDEGALKNLRSRPDSI